MSEKNDRPVTAGDPPGDAVQATLLSVLGRMNDLQTRSNEAHERNNILQERDLRWKNIRIFLIGIMVLLSAAVYWFVGNKITSFGHAIVPDSDYAAVLRLSGPVDSESRVSAAKINPALATAFKDEKAKGIVLLINSPGGSPVQASLIHDRIVSLRAQYPTRKVIAVGEDMLTSAAYLIATGAPNIFVNPSTVTGSVGVISAQFGFPKLLHKLGIERRVYTSGENKGRLDQFKIAAPGDVSKLINVLGKVHEHFINSVLETRKGRLKGDAKVLFSGDFWTGEEAVKLGLVDGIGDLSTLIKREFGVEQTLDYTPTPSVFERLSSSFSLSITELFMGNLEVIAR